MLKFFLRKTISLFLLVVPLNLILLIFKKIVYIKLEKTDPKYALKRLLELDNFIYLLTGMYSLSYGKGIHVKKRLTKYVDYFTSHAKKMGGPCLDIGCGDGELAINIAKQKIKVTGIELSLEQIKKAKEKNLYKNLNFIHGDILNYKSKDLKFKTIILSNVLEHIKNRVLFLKKIKKQFSAQYFLIRVPVFDRDWRVPLKKELKVDHRLDSTHFIEYTDKTLLDELRQSKINVLDLKRIWGEIWLIGKAE